MTAPGDPYTGAGDRRSPAGVGRVIPPPPAYTPSGTPGTAGSTGTSGIPGPAGARDVTSLRHPRSGGTTRLASAWRGKPEDPRWARPGLLALLLGTLLLYLWNLSASGYANSFYSAAVQAGSESWKAFFFGSSDAANSITVDKPPAALWPMALSVRLFGLNAWAVLVPEALMGVAAVGVLHAAVRRRSGPAAGLIAGGVLALTPVAALMFRFNNPDALLALLMTVTVHCVLRALERASTPWLVGAGAAVGVAFLTKTLQAFVILPPLALLYAVCAPTTVRNRLGQLALAWLAVVVTGGWWVAVVELWPAASRPYVGGSQTNSFLELTFGYNGLGRLNGEETGSVGGGGGPGGGRGGGAWGETGVGRMFGESIGGQISWLLPAALILLVAGLVLTRRTGRTGMARAAFLAWGGALLMTLGVFSFMAGIFHEYYTVALAPYIAALVGMGTVALWERRGGVAARAVLGGTVAVTAVWAYVLLERSADWLPWLRWTVVAAGLAAAAGLMLAGRMRRELALGMAGLGLAASLAGPVAYTLSTVGTGHTGSIVTAGPRAAAGMGRPGGGPDGGPGVTGGGMRPPGQAPGNLQQGGGALPTRPQGAPSMNQGQGRGGGFPGGAPGRGAPGRGGGGGGAFGGFGGLLGGPSVSDEVATTLRQNSGDYTWVAAAVGSQNAASHQLASEQPVMPLGGFNGSDPSPTLAQFKKYVEQGRIHYFIAESGGGRGRPGARGPGGNGGPGETRPGGNGSGRVSASVADWVEDNFTEVTVDGTTLYDLTRPAG
ncbi:ArnT family glycosyltransferase [Streptomyces sp. 8N706]|uniref:ArnT family glycosyltransferase n=1 Tax=Streptomyces sp. 8N706 TaxID=3457416 RepID=UPI003FD0287B